jgi:hypothetical protein
MNVVESSAHFERKIYFLQYLCIIIIIIINTFFIFYSKFFLRYICRA